MARDRNVALATMAVAGGVAATAFAGEFGGPRTFCDSSDPAVYWRAQELPGEQNVVVAGFDESIGAVVVRDEGTDAGGDNIDETTTCAYAEDNWQSFIADEGSEHDVVRLDGEIQDSIVEPGPVPERILVEIGVGPGDDEAFGHDGVDDIAGGPGKDLLKAFAGRDRINGNGGKDKIRSGPGRDKVKAAGGGKDKVNCGPGKDKAVVDREDKVQRCEKVKVR